MIARKHSTRHLSAGFFRFWIHSSSALVVKEDVSRPVNLQNVFKFSKGYDVYSIHQSTRKFHVHSDIALSHQIEVFAFTLMGSEVESVQRVTASKIFSTD